MQVVTPGTAGFLATGTLVLLATLATWSDLRTRRIPNVLTVGGLGLALLVSAGSGGDKLVSGLTAAGLTLILGITLFAVGVVGAGDAKLFVAFAALLGLERLPLALLACAVAGGLLVIGMAVRAGVVLPLLMNVRDGLVGMVTLGRSGRILGRAAVGVSVPYGVAISIGALGAWFL